MSARKPQPKFGLASLSQGEKAQPLVPQDMVASLNHPLYEAPNGSISLYQDPERSQYTGYEGKSNGWMVHLSDGNRKFMEWFKQRTVPSATHGCFTRGDNIDEWVRTYRGASAPPRRVTCNGQEVKRPGIYHNLSDHHFALGV